MIRKLLSAARARFSLYILTPIFSHCFNPLYTLYFNFVFFPLRQAIKFPLFVYGWPKLFSQFGKMECQGACGTGMIKLNLSYSQGPQYSCGNTELLIWGKIIFKANKKSDYFEIGSGCRINVLQNGVFIFGANSKILNACNITVFNHLTIGEVSRITHRSQVMDSNYHYLADFNENSVRKHSSPILIGSYCWICNSSTITGGAVIPDRVIVSSNSLVTKDMSDIPEGSVIGGIPAKLLKTGIYKIENVAFENVINDFFFKNPSAMVYDFAASLPKSICDIDSTDEIV